VGFGDRGADLSDADLGDNALRVIPCGVGMPSCGLRGVSFRCRREKASRGCSALRRILPAVHRRGIRRRGVGSGVSVGHGDTRKTP